MIRRLPGILPLLVLCFAACEPVEQPPKITDAQAAAYAQDVGDVADSEGNLIVALLDGAQSSTAEQAAQNVADNATARFSPSGCVTPQVTGPTVALTFADCAGPRGLTGVTGTLTMTLTVNTTTIDAVSSGTGLRVGAVTLDVKAFATYAIDSNNARSLAVHTTGDGTGPLVGQQMFLDGDYTLTWTDTCHTLNGLWTTSVDFGATGDRGTAAVSNVERCGGSCPSSGSIELFDFVPAYVTIFYDGSSTPSYSAEPDPGGDLALSCSP